MLPNPWLESPEVPALSYSHPLSFPREIDLDGKWQVYTGLVNLGILQEVEIRRMRAKTPMLLGVVNALGSLPKALKTHARDSLLSLTETPKLLVVLYLLPCHFPTSSPSSWWPVLLMRKPVVIPWKPQEVQLGLEDLVMNLTGTERIGGWGCSKINYLTKHLINSSLLLPFWMQLFVPIVRFTLFRVQINLFHMINQQLEAGDVMDSDIRLSSNITFLFFFFFFF